jgi:cytochrome c-type biogenesis protein CcmH/NrfG
VETYKRAVQIDPENVQLKAALACAKKDLDQQEFYS